MTAKKNTPKPQGIPDTGKCSNNNPRVCTGKGILRIDPYQADVDNHEVWRYLCDPCTQEIADDI